MLADLIAKIGVTFERQFSGVIAYFKEATTGPELAALIVVTGAIVVLVQVFRFIQVGVILRKGRKIVTSSGATPELFARNFETIQKEFRRLGKRSFGEKLSRAFDEYTETLEQQGFDDEEHSTPVIRNTSRPQDWFQADTLGMDTPMFVSLSNCFLGLPIPALIPLAAI